MISLSPLLGTIIASKFSQNNGLYSFPSRSKLFSTTVNSSFQDFAPISSMGNSVDFNAVLTKAESLLYTLADAAISASPDAGAPVQKNGGWSGFISDAMEVVLKVLKDGLTAVHIPYSYGFAIIFLTVLVKVATFPLTKQQVESTLAMQNLQPKIKAIQERYVGNQESGVGCISLLLSCRPMQAGVNPLAGTANRRVFLDSFLGGGGYDNCCTAKWCRSLLAFSFCGWSSPAGLV